jgi:hypothetical protein
MIIQGVLALVSSKRYPGGIHGYQCFKIRDQVNVDTGFSRWHLFKQAQHTGAQGSGTQEGTQGIHRFRDAADD